MLLSIGYNGLPRGDRLERTMSDGKKSQMEERWISSTMHRMWHIKTAENIQNTNGINEPPTVGGICIRNENGLYRYKWNDS